jgi:hypothetical protein
MPVDNRQMNEPSQDQLNPDQISQIVWATVDLVVIFSN